VRFAGVDFGIATDILVAGDVFGGGGGGLFFDFGVDLAVGSVKGSEEVRKREGGCWRL
jgi:hypothetical protein